jgi:prolyl oligopeptidase
MQEITSKNLFSIKSITDIKLSPDGNLLSYTVVEPFRLKGATRPTSSVWVTQLQDKITYCITPTSMIGFLSNWSPDCSKLAFLGYFNQEPMPQLYILDIRSQRLFQATKVTGEILQLEWSKDGTKLALLIQDHADVSQDPEEFEGNPQYSKICILDLENGALSQVTSNYQVWEFSWSPDTKHFAALISDEPYEWSWHIAKVALINVNSGEFTIVHNSIPRQIGSVKWSLDGKKVLFISSIFSDRGLVGGDLYELDPFAKTIPVNLTKDKLGSVHCYDFIDSNKLVILSVNMAETLITVMNVNKKENKSRLICKEKFGVNPDFYPKFTFSRRSHSLALVREDFQSPQEVWAGKLFDNKISWVQVTHLNDKSKQLFEVIGELVKWKSFDGTKIQGFIYRKSGELQKRPLIVEAHGGPSYGYGYRFEVKTKYFVSQGFNVLLPNPRGSMGRGTKFLEMDRGNLDGDDFKDIRAGIDYCIKQGYADPNNLFITGASYGGYLVAWAITQTNIFNAAIVNFGISNLLSCHGTEWNIYWEQFVFDIDPYKKPEDYHRKSPIELVKNVSTPTLILHGKEDPCVHISQAMELFRALKQLGIETRLIIYPREKHGWNEKEHILDALSRQLEWFNKHIKN